LRRFTHSNGVPSNLRQQLGLNPDVVLMGFLGRFMEQKGFLVLADALAELNQSPPARPFHLVAVGSGDLLVNYQNMLDGKPDVLRRISFLPQTPDPASVLRELDLLVMPSLWEAHPLLPMEAMLVGVPIVGTSCLGLREVLRGSPSMMVPPGDAKALARALRQAISAPWKDAAMDYAAKAKDRFDVRHTADRLLSLFEHVGTRTHTRPRRD
jgi:glycosyltransferase involved in cell wall biosynthesis